MHKTLAKTFMAVFLTLASISANAEDLPPMECSDVHHNSDRLKGNALGDHSNRPARFCKPKDFDERPGATCALVVLHPGMGMFRNEDTIEDIMTLRNPYLASVNPAYPAKFGGFTLDTDGIIQNMMDTGEIQDDVCTLEISPIASNGSGWGLPSEVGGDQLGWIREYVDHVRNDPQYRIRPGRNNLFTVGFSTGAFVSFVQATTQQSDQPGEEGLPMYSGMATLSPAGTNYRAPGPPPDNLIRLFLWRNFPIRVAMTGIPVHKGMKPQQLRDFWGTVPGQNSQFWASAWCSVTEIAAFNPFSPWNPVCPLADGLLTDEFDRTSPANMVTMDKVATYDMRHALFVHGAGNNLKAMSSVFISRGNDKDQSGNAEVALHPEVPDGFLLPVFLNQVGVQNTYVLGPGDHFTNLNYPNGPSNFRIALKHLFDNRGKPVPAGWTWNPAYANRFAPIQAMFPHEGGW